MNSAASQLVTLETCALQIPVELHRDVYEPADALGSRSVAVIGREQLYFGRFGGAAVGYRDCGGPSLPA